MAWADCKWRSLTRGRITCTDARRLEDLLASWKDRTHDELKRVERRMAGLVDMLGVDQLADLQLEEG